MAWNKDLKKGAALAVLFACAFYVPVGIPRFDNAVLEAFHLVKWYAREHVLLCLVPAFFIAGAIGVFVSQASVMKYLDAGANKVLAYGIASVSGTVLAVCSCTVLPLFAGIYKMGAGIGPATAFLYAGPAINILSIILTARILGAEMGIARAVGAIVFSIVIGLTMHLLFRKEEKVKAATAMAMPDTPAGRPLWQTVFYFTSMIGILVFANWGAPAEARGVWAAIHGAKWILTSVFAIGFALTLLLVLKLPLVRITLIALPTAAAAILFRHQPLVAFAVGSIGLAVITAADKNEAGDWFSQTWGFVKQISPLLLFGVLAAGFFLGRVGHEGIIPTKWISALVGGNSLGANLFASIVGAFMYFATLTEVPILQGLVGSGMGKGPALALLLAGPALSLQSVLVINAVMGWKKTFAYVTLVVVMSTVAGMIYETFF
jgi:uncharacterized membrane protein YraQ (UPF0718 family)